MITVMVILIKDNMEIKVDSLKVLEELVMGKIQGMDIEQ